MTDRPTAAAWAVLGLLVAVTPYLGRPLGLVVDVAATTEAIDHVLPGLLVVAAAPAIVRFEALRFELTLLAVLAGLWATSSHLPLVLDAVRGRVGWPTALWHTTSAVALLAVTAWSAVVQFRADDDGAG